MSTTQQQIETITQRMLDRRTRYESAQRIDQQELLRLRELRHRELLSALVGKPDGVKTRYQYPTSDNAHRLNHQQGTLLEVKRTRCLVKFGQTKWNFAVADIVPANQEQGLAVEL